MIELIIYVGKKVLRKRRAVATYGSSIKIKGKRYYIIGKDIFAKKANFWY